MKLRTQALVCRRPVNPVGAARERASFSQKPPLPGIDVLKQDAGGYLEVTWNPQTGTPSFIRGHIPVAGIGLASTGQSATIALGVADRYAALLGVVQSAQGLRAVQQETDALGAAHVTLAQSSPGG